MVAVIEQLELGRAHAMEHLVARLKQTGRLHERLTPRQAVDVLLVVTDFAAWDQLVIARNRSAEDAAGAIIDLAVRAVVDDN